MASKRVKALIAALVISPALLPFTSFAAGSTTPAFLVDVNNPASFTFSGSTVNSSITESANNVAGTATGLTLDSSAPTRSLVFGSNKYLSFSNSVKPDITNGVSIQIVAYLTSSSYDSSWPRVLDMGPTNGWGGGYDNFSIQLSDSGQFQIYMSRSGTSGGYFCGTTSSAVSANAFAMYSFRLGPGGVCNISVNGVTAASTNSEATQTYASKVPNIASTLNFRIGTMNTNVQSTLPSGKIRTVILSSGTSSTNAVTFMENGGTGYMASQLGSSSAALNSNTYTRSGYAFTGWNTKSDGTGTSYSEGATYNFGSASSMLFAQWAIAPPSLSLPQIATTNYRSTVAVDMTINSAGTYTFFENGKRIPRCISLSGTPPTVRCNWKPAKIGGINITASGKVSSTTYYSNSVRVNVVKRSGTR